MQCLTDLIFYLELQSQYLRIRSLLYCIVTSGSLSSRITLLSDFYRHFGFIIFEHFIAQCDYLGQKDYLLIPDLSCLTLQIIFDACWASMNVGSKRDIASKHSWHVPSWRFYLHCGVEETRSHGIKCLVSYHMYRFVSYVSFGIMCIVCYQVLRHPSHYGTSSMGKHLLLKGHIANLKEFIELEITELTGSMVDETAWAILKRQGSRRITIVSLQRQILFDIQVNPYWSKWQT